MRRMISRKSKTYHWILLSYLIVILVTLLFNLGFSILSRQMLEDEILSSHERSLSRLQSLMDTNLREMETHVGKIAKNNNIQSLAVQQWAPKGPSYYYQQVQIYHDLADGDPAGSITGSVYVWFLQDGFFLTGKGRYDEDEFFHSLQERNVSLSPEEWRDCNENVMVREYKVLPVSVGQPCIAYMCNVITSAGWAKQAIVGAILNQDILIDDLSNAAWVEGGGICILDENRTCILSSSADLQEWAVAYSQSSDQADGGILAYGGKEYYALEARSQVNGWRYLSAIPSKALMHPRDLMVQRSLVFLVIALVISVLLCVLTARLQYAPLRRMVNTLGGGTIQGSEYRFIEKAISNILDENSSLQRALNEKEDYLRNSGLIQLVMEQSLEKAEIEQLISECGIQFREDHYHVLCASIHHRQREQWEEGRILLHELIEAVPSLQNLNHYNFMLQGALVIIVNCPAGMKLREKLVDECRMISSALNKSHRANVCIGISAEGQGMTALPKLYRQAKKAETKLREMRGDGVAVYDSSTEMANALEMRTENEEARIRNLLTAGEYAQASEELYGLISLLLEPDPTGLSQSQYRTFKVLDVVNRIFYDLIPSYGREMAKTMQGVSEEIKGADAGEEIRIIQNMVDQLIEASKKSGHLTAEREVAERVVQIIKRSYSSPDLSVQSLAEQAGVSQATLTRSFKKCFNCGALEYIHQYRVAMAKQLMEKEKYGIQEIALRTGFYNNSTFIRVFKKYEGVTPGEFRRIAPTNKEEME